MDGNDFFDSYNTNNSFSDEDQLNAHSAMSSLSSSDEENICHFLICFGVIQIVIIFLVLIALLGSIGKPLMFFKLM